MGGIPEYSHELSRIYKGFANEEFAYDFDLSFTVGSEFVPVTKPTGLDCPRVSTAKKKVTGTIFIREDDTKKASDRTAFMRKVFRESLKEVLQRTAKKDPTFDADEAFSRVLKVLED